MGEDRAVSQVVSFILTFVIMSAATVTIIYTTSILINNRVKETTYIVAQDIANYVSNVITETLAVKQNYPLANHSTYLDVPRDILGKSYYIEVTDNYVYVNVSGGRSAKCYLYKQRELAIPCSGKVYSGSGKIRVWTERNDPLYLLDFGVNSSSTSPAAYKFLRVTESSCRDSLNPWDTNFKDWMFRSKILVRNPSDEDLSDYQIRLNLNPDNFCYFVARKDGGDIRITNEKGELLPYWIEIWRYQGVSYVWFKADYLPANSTATFYLYYGNPNATSLSNGYDTFPFFDDFNEFNESKWETPYGDDGVYVNYGHLILRDGCAVLAKGETVSNGVLSVKARVVLLNNSNNTEASLFIRSTSSTDPFNNSYLLSSGIFFDPAYSDRNFSIGKHDDLYSENAISMENFIWYSINFYFYNNYISGLRYRYYNPTYYERLNRYDAIETYSGGFGLYTSVDGAYAEYDWVFLRNYYYIEPYVVDIDGPASQVYRFTSNINNLNFFTNTSESDKLLRDGVKSKYPGVLNITLPNGNYSLVFYIGNPDTAINNLDVCVEGKEVIHGLSCDAGEVVTKCVYVDLRDGNIDILFKPNDVWSLLGLEVLSGKRGVFVGGG